LHPASIARNPAIDGLRGIAILAVLCWHAFAIHLVSTFPSLAGPLSLLWSGVDLFFVLSGFLIGSILLANATARNYFQVFYARRAARILPLYAIVIGLSIWLAVDENTWVLVFFLQNIQWSLQERFGHAVVGVTWSLAVEEQFYLVLPPLIRFLPTKYLPATLALLIGLAPALRTALWLSGHDIPAYLLLPCRMDSLFAGVLAAWFLSSDHRRALIERNRTGLKVLTGVFVLGLWGLASAELTIFSPLMVSVGYTFIAAVYVLVLVLVVTSQRPFPKLLLPLSWAGIGAYSLYLFHLPLAVYWPKILFEGASVAEGFGSYIAALAFIAFVAWWLIERPLIKFVRKALPYERQDPQLPTILTPEAELMPQPMR
jgi:peptidoglycan/LPS O-acetylase OafA/YrhL